MSRGTHTLACMAVGLSGVGSSALPSDSISRAVAADEKAYGSTTGKHYHWEIMLPGSLAGAIVGYATQRFGRRPGDAGT